MSDFTQDEIECLKKMIYKFRQDEILELYKKRQFEEMIFITTISGGGCCPTPKKSFLDKVKDAIVNFFRKTKIVSVEVINTKKPNKNNNYYPPGPNK